MEEINVMEQETVVDDFYAERVLNRRAERIAERDRLLDDCKKMIEFYNEKMEEIENSYKSSIAYDEGLLYTYASIVPMKETATQKTYKLPSGKLTVTKAKKDFEPDKEKLLEYLKGSFTEFVKVKEEPAWGEFKKLLEISGDSVINTVTGEVVDCVSVIEKPESFSIK